MTAISLIGKKIGMTQIFDMQGSAVPVTILEIGPCIVTQIKTLKTDGYEAIQIGYHNVQKKSLSKCELGHLNKFKLPQLKYLKEFRVNSCEDFNVGQEINLSSFKVGDRIHIKAKGIGKGFTGYQKRHKFTRGPMSHGSKNHRQPGSIGAGTTPGRVFPGKKMAGRMGGKEVTVSNLRIVDIKTKDNLLLVKGSVPGKPGNIIRITNK